MRAADDHITFLTPDAPSYGSINADRPPSSLGSTMSSSSSASWKLIFYATGIFVSYAVFGIFQERILRGEYGPQKERFSFQFSLVLIQCSMNALMAKGLLATVWPQGKDPTTMLYYAASSFFYLAAMVTSFSALTYVNYPTQVVAKSCKPIPVMILGMIIARKRYSIQKYLFVLLIIIGVVLFILKDKKDDTENTYFGNVLLIISLTCDGLIGGIQDKMRQKFQTKSLHMMFSMNAFSLIYVVVGLLYTDELPQFLAFIMRHPQVCTDIAIFAICSAVGQIFIYSTVAEFSPLMCSIVTTTRKFFTVLASVLLFGNALSYRQWIGTGFVFTGLFLDAFYGKTSHAGKHA